MALLPDFEFRVNPGDLIPTALLALSEEDQIEKWGTFQEDIEDALRNIANFRAAFPVTLIAPSAAVVYTNAPSGAAAEWGGSPRWRTWIDLAGLTEARVSAVVEVAGAATASMGVQYSANGGSSFQFFDGGNGPSVDIDSTGVFVSGWVPMVSAAQNDVVIRPVHVGGDGAADPALGLVVVQFR